MLRAVRDMYSPHSNQLSKAQLVLGIGVPEPYCEYAGVIGQHDLEVALRSFVTLARLGYVVEVHYAPCEHQIARARFKRD